MFIHSFALWIWILYNVVKYFLFIFCSWMKFSCLLSWDVAKAGCSVDLIVSVPEVECLFHLKPDLVHLFRISYLTVLPLQATNTISNVLHCACVCVWNLCMRVHLCGRGVMTCMHGAWICKNSLLNYQEERSVRGVLIKRMYQMIALNISHSGERETAVALGWQAYCCGHHSLTASLLLFSWPFSICLSALNWRKHAWCRLCFLIGDGITEKWSCFFVFVFFTIDSIFLEIRLVWLDGSCKLQTLSLF